MLIIFKVKKLWSCSSTTYMNFMCPEFLNTILNTIFFKHYFMSTEEITQIENKYFD